MKILLHQTHHTIGDFEAIEKTLLSILTRDGIHLFPELYLTGYPLGDLCLQSSFIEHYRRFFEKLSKTIEALPVNQEIVALIGGLEYEFSNEGVPNSIKNVIFEIKPGHPLKQIYTKRLLPNYDIFDEQKYFTAGTQPGVWSWNGKRFGLMVCEDMWASSFHKLDPAMDLAALGPFDAVLNLSASPFNVGKAEKRRDRARTLSHLFKAPFFYVNRVGAEDEILFDGASFAVNGDETLVMGPIFAAHTLTIPLPPKTDYKPVGTEICENTWESLFEARFSVDKSLPRRLHVWDDEECHQVLEGLKFSLQDYAQKNGFKKFVVALSGGMDSALALTIAKLSLASGQELEAVYMPGNFSAPLSWELSLQICQKLGIKLTSLPIKFLHSNVKMAFQSNFPDAFEGLTDENVQSRLRGMLIYTRSNQTGSMVINTSNKSEIAVGYSTQYGDSVGALSLLGDLYKSEVYRLAEWINANKGELIPKGIISRAPSAELRENQKDEDSLPPYDRLDAMLEGILSFRYNAQGLLSLGFYEDEVKRVFHLYSKTEYKRRQFCPIVKIKSKSFGFGYRVPISKNPGLYQA
ncbi:MAG: NAD(+) synthase [Bacteriovoracaceae bacterium]|nr:NAD(+) synthase [Bacteriovoracaceae bacterium]